MHCRSRIDCGSHLREGGRDRGVGDKRASDPPLQLRATKSCIWLVSTLATEIAGRGHFALPAAQADPTIIAPLGDVLY